MKWASDIYSRNEQESLITGWAVAIFVAALLSVAINAKVTSSGGYDDQEHRGSVPAGVQQINPKTYIADRGNPILLAQICLGDPDTDSDTVTRESYPKSLDGKRYIECERSQIWNVYRAPKPSFWTAALDTLTTPAWVVPIGIAVIMLVMYPLLLTFGSWRAGAPARRAERRASKQKPLELEQARRELVRAYSTDEINDLEFQTGMDKLYASGLKRAEE